MKSAANLVLLLIGAILCACGGPTTYTVTGNLNGFLASYAEGAVVDSAYIKSGDSIIGNKVAVAPNGDFTLTGAVDAPVEAYLVAECTVPGGKGKSSKLFVLENGKIHFNDVLNDDIQGTPLNDAVYAEIAWLNQTTDASEAKLQRTAAFIEKYKHTPAPAALISYIASKRIFTVAEKETLINNADPCILESEFVGKYASTLLWEQKMRKALANTQAGNMFTDFEVEYNGKVQRLSDYVGKGKYVLVDFWASWCYPCRMEIPTVIDLYKKYKNKGLEVVGVAVSDKPEHTLKAIKEFGIPYPQILNGQLIPMETYGVSGIPHIILFSPDGTILKRGLRGEEIEKAVREYL